MTTNILTKMLPAASSMRQLIKGTDKVKFLGADDDVMMKQIMATHSPDGHDVDVKPLLHLVDDILNRATMNVDGIVLATQAHLENMEEKAHQASFIATIDAALSFNVAKISCELKCRSGVDAHQTTVSIFNMLSTYPWDAKLVLVLAAFALNNGEFWLLAQLYRSNPLAKSMAILKQLPFILEHSAPLKPQFDALNNLIKVILDLTKCIVASKDLLSMSTTEHVPAFSAATAHIRIAVSWTIRSVVACATQITSLTSMSQLHEYGISTAESLELWTLTQRLNSISDHLKKQLALCNQHIEEKQNAEALQRFMNVFEMVHTDNMEVLKTLIYDRKPLVYGPTKKEVNIDVLSRKNVLLLISGLDIYEEELSILKQIYDKSRVDSLYEVVWIPVIDPSIQWTDTQFEILQSRMPWYSVYHPNLIERVVIRFIKEVWHFKNKPMLVVLDPQGKVVCPNAIDMMWIWGNNAFPFTSLEEDALWRKETSWLELLVNDIDQTILTWMREEKYIFLYGGDNMKWIQQFTTKAREVADASRITLEMVYVGKSSKREKIIESNKLEKPSYVWGLTERWYFWTRIDSILFSKIQQGRADDDIMTREIKKLLSYDRSGGWAVLSKGTGVVINGHISTTVLPTLLQYDLWKEHVPDKGFDISIKDHHDKLRGNTHLCCQIDFLSTAKWIPENMKCPECLRLMKKNIAFLCCHDDK